MREKELIEGLRRGDMSSYEQLFHAWYPRLVRYADSVVNDFDVAKDLVQNVFMKVWQHRSRLQGDLSIGSWLHVLTRNEALNHLRSRRYVETMYFTPPHVPDSHRVTEIGVQEDNADAALIREEVARMPEQRRKVFGMSRLLGLTNKEIAQVLSLSEKTVERHITLANRHLKKTFEK